VKKAKPLSKKWTTEIKPRSPFNFDGSFYHPAHFPMPTEEYQPGKWYNDLFGKIIKKTWIPK